MQSSKKLYLKLFILSDSNIVLFNSCSFYCICYMFINEPSLALVVHQTYLNVYSSHWFTSVDVCILLPVSEIANYTHCQKKHVPQKHGSMYVKKRCVRCVQINDRTNNQSSITTERLYFDHDMQNMISKRYTLILTRDKWCTSSYGSVTSCDQSMSVSSRNIQVHSFVH